MVQLEIVNVNMIMSYVYSICNILAEKILRHKKYLTISTCFASVDGKNIMDLSVQERKFISKSTQCTIQRV